MLIRVCLWFDSVYEKHIYEKSKLGGIFLVLVCPLGKHLHFYTQSADPVQFEFGILGYLSLT